MPDTPVGHLLRAARKRAGMTQTALAASMGLSISYINLVEHDRRRLTPARLADAAAALGVDAKILTADPARQLTHDLEALVSDPVLGDERLDPGEIRALVARHEPWAKALVALHRSTQRDQGVIAAFADRLNHDPVLSDSIHEMLNASTAIRSVATIFEEAQDLDPAQRRRFDKILAEEAGRLAEVAHSLAGFFERRDAPGTALTAPEEVDDFLYESRNYFPALEEAMDGVRGKAATPETGTLAVMLEARRGIRVRRVPTTALPPNSHRLTHFDSRARVLSLADGLPRSTERFEIARRIAEHAARGPVAEAIAAAKTLTSDEARNRATGALHAYAAAALLMPYEPFYEAAESSRYDIDALTMTFGASPEQLCHRFTTLRRPGAEGVPFAFLRANAAGYLTKRFPLPRLPMPRFGGACPLWAVYAAMQTPDLRQRQLAEFPNGDRYFFIARATRPMAQGFGETMPSYALMLACDALNADRLVYSDGLDLSPAARADPVGPTCLLCSRESCAHRQERSVRTRV